MPDLSRALKRKLSPLIVVLALGVLAWDEISTRLPAGPDSAAFGPAGASADARLAQAFENRESDLQIAGSGTVVHVLPDDTKGSQHQRFLLELSTGQTLLVAHNIDLAPRVPELARGDRIGFFGEYEWTEKGGVIHWTHHDPGGRHVDGWLEREGRRFE